MIKTNIMIDVLNKKIKMMIIKHSNISNNSDFDINIQ
jgi:hypothetical protein